jgi:hypothetical protein
VRFGHGPIVDERIRRFENRHSLAHGARGRCERISIRLKLAFFLGRAAAFELFGLRLRDRDTGGGAPCHNDERGYDQVVASKHARPQLSVASSGYTVFVLPPI